MATDSNRPYLIMLQNSNCMLNGKHKSQTKKTSLPNNSLMWFSFINRNGYYASPSAAPALKEYT